jgi:tocopherol cyclase
VSDPVSFVRGPISFVKGPISVVKGPISFVKGLRRPEAFHGTGVTSGFFEGWYVKLVSADTAQRWAVIPGVFRGLEQPGQPRRDEAFVQVLDGSTGESWYHAFPVDQFRASSDGFDVTVSANRFSPSGVTLDLPQLAGRIDFTSPMDPWPVTWRSPGIMGWYGLVPFMECYHGLVSFGHGLRGTVSVRDRQTSFDDGRGYLEKDWGKAFPAGYVWLHSNHIDADPTASLVASVALIPWVRSTFRGFIIGLKHHGRLYRWATYNRSREELLAIDDTHVHWTLDGPDGRLRLSAERTRGGLLHAPLRSAMHQRVEETMDGRITVRHEAADGRVLLEGLGTSACMEVFGDIERLLATKGR